MYNLFTYSLDLSIVYGFKPCILVCFNFLRYEKTHNLRILNANPRMVEI